MALNGYNVALATNLCSSWDLITLFFFRRQVLVAQSSRPTKLTPQTLGDEGQARNDEKTRNNASWDVMGNPEPVRDG